MIKPSLTPFLAQTFLDVTEAAKAQRNFIQNQLDDGWSIRSASITTERDFETGNDVFIVNVRCLWIPGAKE